MVNVFNGIFYGSSGRFDVLLSSGSRVSCGGPPGPPVDAMGAHLQSIDVFSLSEVNRYACVRVVYHLVVYSRMNTFASCKAVSKSLSTRKLFWKTLS